MELLNEDQTLIAQSAAGFLADTHNIAAFRALRDAAPARGFDPAVLPQMAEMGWMGVLLPESAGGIDFGHRAAGLIAQQMGRNLSACPFLSTAILAASVFETVGGATLTQLGPRIAAGELVVALALEESAKHRPDQIATTVTRQGEMLVLNGRKNFVVDGFGADHLIVVAQEAGAPLLLLVDPSTTGVTVAPQRLLDTRNAAQVIFEDVALPPAAVLAQGQTAEVALAKALRAGRAVAAAEQLGVAYAAAEQTFDYLRTRKQFGLLIGQFQALQHRAADLYCALAQTSSLVAVALNALDADLPEAEALTRAAKAKVARVGRQATEEGVQMHGGIGMTDEMDLGLFMKRDRALSEFLGDAGCHTEWLLRHRGI